MKKNDIRFTGERFLPEIEDKKLATEHFQRYMSICNFITGKNVLDAACGEGYGSFLMAEYADSVTGIDISVEVVREAEIKYCSRSNLKFLAGNISQLPVEDHCIDVVVSYETIEHVDEKIQFQFLKEITRVLRSDGVLIMSTPNKLIYSDLHHYQNEFHKKEFYKEEFVAFLKSEFRNIKLYHQFFEVSSIIDDGGNIKNWIQYYSDDFGDSREGKYYIAVACNTDLPEIDISNVYLKSIGEYEENIQRILNLQNEEEHRNSHIKKLNIEIAEKGQLIHDLQKEIEERNDHIHKLDDEIDQIKDVMAEAITEKNNAIQLMSDFLEQNKQQLKQNKQQLEQNKYLYDQYRRQTEKELTNYRIRLEKMKEEASAFKQEAQKQNAEFLNLEMSLRQIRERNIELQKENAEINNRLQEAKQKEQTMKQTIVNKEGHIDLLLEVERTYLREKETHAYKMAKNIQRVFNAILPTDSRRRFFLRILYHIVRHPRLMLHVINPKRIKNYRKYIRKEGIEGVKSRYVDAVAKERCYRYPASNIEINLEQSSSGKEKAAYQEMEFIKQDHPVVSIIIPVFNEFGYTYNCLKSIFKNSGNIPYEILIADDCSTDTTAQIQSIIKNIHVFTTDHNLGFLLNCKNAASYAKGKYLLFLNNDTQVQNNWLEPLITLMEKDTAIGMAGSKLLYEDGRLQEAGGIVWNDASAWNYGHLENPEDAPFNYVKETDYISGAAIIIRRNLWNEIGGFDERFTPAYYEDTDLAFEVRKHGYKVMYQPLSRVVHFEGISNGTDESTGIKQYQQANKIKFLEKWKEELQSGQAENGTVLFKAKDRSIHKIHILVIDHYVPHYDVDAGGKCTYMYLKLFVHMGFQVTFIGDNFYNHEPYTTHLNQMGIEVLYGNYYYHNWKNWIRENGHYFDYIYLQRPHISIKYIDLVREYSRAKIFYFAHDLHHIRERREYELTKDPNKLKSSEEWKHLEYELFSKADVGHVVGSYEQSIMQHSFPDKPIRNIPLYIYEENIKNVNKDFSERSDLIYVGGFGHPPNIDAVLWFAKEVFPKVQIKYPHIIWHVVGGKVPKEIAELANDHILIKGFISDEQLDKLYRKCRMAVVPLRVGAGVKGKVVEAAYYQIPLVTTTIGAEGLDCTAGNFIVEDKAEEMAGRICELYEDYPELTRMSDAGSKFIQDHFTQHVAKEVIRLDMGKE